MEVQTLGEELQGFVDRIRDIETLPQDQLVSFDVTSHVTQVLVDEALRSEEAKLDADETLHERTSIPSTHLFELVELCLGLPYFEFQGKLYEPSDTATTSSPLSPVIANMYLERLEGPHCVQPTSAHTLA